MKTFHILAYLYGEADASAALIEITTATAAAIQDALATVRNFAEKYGGYTSINYDAPDAVHFLSEIPDAYQERFGDYSALIDGPLLLEDFDSAAFLNAARDQELYLDTDSHGFVIAPLSISIDGYQEGFTAESHTQDIADILLARISTIAPADALHTFTFWCQQADGSGTIYIGSLEAADLEAAKIAAVEMCCEDWNAGMVSEIPAHTPDNVHLLGIAAGDVEILHWDDIDT